MISLWRKESGEDFLKERTFDIQLCLLGTYYVPGSGVGLGDVQERSRQDHWRLQGANIHCDLTMCGQCSRALPGWTGFILPALVSQETINNPTFVVLPSSHRHGVHITLLKFILLRMRPWASAGCR